MTCQNSFCGQGCTWIPLGQLTVLLHALAHVRLFWGTTVHGQRDLWSLKPEGAVDGDSGDRISSEVEFA